MTSLLNNTNKTSTTGFLGGTMGTYGQSQIEFRPSESKLFDRIKSIVSCYHPRSKNYKFCYIVYDKADNLDDIVIPKRDDCQCISDEYWKKVIESCPKCKVPSIIMGFNELHARKTKQEEDFKKLKNNFEKLEQRLHQISHKFDTEIGKLESLRRSERELSDGMKNYIKECRKNINTKLTNDEKKYLSLFKEIKEKLSNISYNDQNPKYMNTSNRTLPISFDSESLKSICDVLSVHTQAIESLQSTIRDACHKVEELELKALKNEKNSK